MYSQDLPYIHQSGFQQLIRQAAPELLALFVQQGLQGGTVVDLGCGSGYWLKELANAQYQPIGVDPSLAFIEMAEQTAPEATLIQSSAFEFPLPTCQAVTAIGEVLCYRNQTEKLSLMGLFEKVFDALLPRGVFAFDLLIQDSVSPMNYKQWQVGDDWAVLVDVREDVSEEWLTRDIQLFRTKDGHHYVRSQEFHRLQVYAIEKVLNQLRQCGFTASSLPGYGNCPLPTRRQAFIAIKPS